MQLLCLLHYTVQFLIKFVLPLISKLIIVKRVRMSNGFCMSSQCPQQKESSWIKRMPCLVIGLAVLLGNPVYGWSICMNEKTPVLRLQTNLVRATDGTSAVIMAFDICKLCSSRTRPYVPNGVPQHTRYTDRP